MLELPVSPVVLPPGLYAREAPYRRSRVESVARAVEELTVAGLPAVVPEVTGTAYRTGTHTFELDQDDELGTGFLLR
jgi:hypothetical protein